MPKNRPMFIEIGPGLSILAGLPTIESWNSSSRPKNPQAGTFGFNIQTNNLEYWNGKDWYSTPMSED